MSEPPAADEGTATSEAPSLLTMSLSPLLSRVRKCRRAPAVIQGTVALQFLGSPP